MKRLPPVFVYTVLRLLTFAVPLTLLIVLRVTPWLATVLAALIGLSVSYIFLRAPREQVALDLYERRHSTREKPAADEEAEDAAIAGAEQSHPAEHLDTEKPNTDELEAKESDTEESHAENPRTSAQANGEQIETGRAKTDEPTT